jgi:dihydroorotase
MKTLIQNVQVVNEGKITKRDVLIHGEYIWDILPPNSFNPGWVNIVVDGTGKYLLPGAIDDQVHFREPGLTHKAEIYTEAKAAVAGGITSFMEMPNTVPNTVTIAELEKKFERAQEVSLANYSFYLGATHDNVDQIKSLDIKNTCGIKIFMGSSTGNMLVDDQESLNKIFQHAKTLIATHCEDDQLIAERLKSAQSQFPQGIPMSQHPIIRNDEACYRSSEKAIGLARKHDARLHILHISTAKEIDLFDNSIPLTDKRITAEACLHHLWFSDDDYETLGSRIKWNPAVKSPADRAAVRQALIDGKIDVMATDHAPHTLEEKSQSYEKCPSGGPLVQHALPAALEMVHQGIFTLEMIVEKMSHNVAGLYQIPDRGFIKKGFKADCVLVDLNSPWLATDEESLYKCKWTPFNGTTFQSKVLKTWVNGICVFDEGNWNETIKGQALTFSR